MTLTEALAALQQAGKVRNRWLPGMLFDLGDSGRARLCWADDVYWHAAYPGGWLRLLHQRMPEYAPVLIDPPTVGCLLALLREASGDRSAFVALSTCGVDNPWWAQSQHAAVNFGGGPTEGEALAAALIALAGGGE